MVDCTGEGGLNVKQRKALMAYLGYLAPRLGLSAWDIFLRPEPCENPEHAATVSCIPGRKIANIQVAVDFFDTEPEKQRHVLVHELIHIHVDQEFQLIEDTLPGMIGSVAYHPFQAAFRSLHEHGVDAMASVLAPHYPLPTL